MTSNVMSLSLFLLLAVLSLALGGCCTMKTESESQVPKEQADATLKDEPQSNVVSKEAVGTIVLLEGHPQRRKGGITVVGSGFEVWLLDEGLVPDDVFGDDATGPLMRFSGTLDEDQGLPVFIEEDSDLAVQGIPMPLGTDLEKARHRFVLRDAVIAP